MKRLTDPQFFALWAIALGGTGRSARPNTLKALERRGLIYGVNTSQGRHEWVWNTTTEGESVVNNDGRADVVLRPDMPTAPTQTGTPS